MGLISDTFSGIYLWGRNHSRHLIFVLVILFGVGAAGFLRLTLNENVQRMLPDGTADDKMANFDLIQQVSLFRNIVIHLSAGPDTSTDQLIQTTADLADALSRHGHFTHIVTGPDRLKEPALFQWLFAVMPSLLSPSDLTTIESGLSEAAIYDALNDMRNQLDQPEGLFSKRLFQVDPLNFRALLFEKLRHLNVFAEMRIEKGHFVSVDGHHSLIIANTPVPITDYRAGMQLLAGFDALREKWIPEGVDAQFISGHRYTVANASAIRRDMKRVLFVSVFGLILIFVLFFRKWQLLPVFLVPGAAFFFAAAGMGLFFGEVSAITIGFGAVLMGLTIDFALHITMALTVESADPATAVGRVSKPIFFGGVTTLTAFGVLLFSHLPAQRELGLFAIFGLVAGLFLALMVLPQLIAAKKQKMQSVPLFKITRPFSVYLQKSGRFVLIGIWLVILAVALWQGQKITVDGDLKNVNFTPSTLLKAENELVEQWGDFRSRAVVFCEGNTLEEALAANRQLYETLTAGNPESSITTLAPLLPPRKVQKINQARWRAFWTDDRLEILKERIGTAGNQLGFRENAFDRFFEQLGKESSWVSMDDLNRSVFKTLVERLVIINRNPVRVLSLVPDEESAIAQIHRLSETNRSIKLISQKEFGRTISHAIKADFIRFMLNAVTAVFLTLIILFKNVKKVLLTLIPVVSGITFMVGVMGLMGWRFNLFNIIATILVLGFSVDYGIFMVVALTGKNSLKTSHGTCQAVLVSGLTTLAGFGALMAADHPAVASIGWTVSLGVIAAVFAALWIIPLFISQ